MVATKKRVPKSKETERSEVIENYLKVIFVLNIEMGKQFAKTIDIATLLGVSLPSVTEMLQKLSKLGYVDYIPRKGAVLRQKALELAMKLVKRNRLIKLFLVNVLKVNYQKAHKIACQMEHIIDEEFEERLDAYLGYPKTCPLGSPIPRSLEDIATLEKSKTSLDEIDRPGKYVVLRILDINRQTFDLLLKLGVHPGKVIDIVEIFPDSSFLVNIDGKEHVLSLSILKSVIVRH